MFKLVFKLVKILADGRISLEELKDLLSTVFPEPDQNPVLQVVITILEMMEDGRVEQHEVERLLKIFVQADERRSNN